MMQALGPKGSGNRSEVLLQSPGVFTRMEIGCWFTNQQLGHINRLQAIALGGLSPGSKGR